MTATVRPEAVPTRVRSSVDPLALYERALRDAARVLVPETPPDPTDLLLLDPAGERPAWRVPVAWWCGGLRPGDGALLARCHAATLDVGCGPGRLTAALARRGVPVLGIDISPEAVRQAHHRGAPARLACVLTSDPDRLAGEREQRWRHVLLADGNVGIGGAPHRLLARCAGLLRPGGDLLVEVGPPGTGSWAGPVALAAGGERSTPFPWAVVAADDIGAVAARAGTRVRETWTEARRWFARITR